MEKTSGEEIFISCRMHRIDRNIVAIHRTIISPMSVIVNKLTKRQLQEKVRFDRSNRFIYFLPLMVLVCYLQSF